MKDLKEYEEEIYRCSRCALCQSVCPVYKASLNECAVSKGKFNMLNGILKGDLSMTKQIKKYLDLCTGCNACKDFCPSGIDARKIFIAAKNEYYKSSELSLFEKIMNSYNLFKTALVFAGAGFRVYRFIRADLIVDCLEKCLLKMKETGKRLLLMNFLASSSFSSAAAVSEEEASAASAAFKHKKNYPKTKAIYFEGCFNKYINPQTENAVKQILSACGTDLAKKDFECCGVSYLNDGNIKSFRKLVNKNLSKIDCDFDYFLTDCASCYDVLKLYKDFSQDEKARQIDEKIVSVTNLIKNINFEAVKKLRVSIHLPCHEEFDLEAFVKNIKNIEYTETEDFNKCCGFSGTFALKNPEISKEISRQKAQHYIDSKTDIVLTTCPACMLGLEQGFIETGVSKDSRPSVMNLFVFLAHYCKSV